MKKYILKILPFILIFVMLFGMNVSAATATEYPIYWSTLETVDGMFPSDFAYQAWAWAINGTSGKVWSAYDDCNILVIKTSETSANVLIVNNGGSVYGNDTNNIYASGDVLRFYGTSSAAHLYYYNGAFQDIYGLASWDKFTLTVGSQSVFYASQDIYNSNSGTGILMISGTGRGLVWEDGDGNISYGDYEYNGKNDFVNDGSTGVALGHIQLEELVTDDEQPNVFLRIFQNIGIILSNTFTLIEYFANLVNHYFNELLGTAFDYLFTLLDPILQFVNIIKNKMIELLEWVLNLADLLETVFTNLFLKLWNLEIIEGLSLHSIWEFFEDKLNTVGEYISGLSSGEITASDIIISALPDRLEELINGFYNLGYQDMEFSLAVMFERLLVPEDGYFKGKVDTVVLSKFGFINGIYDFIDSVKSVLSNQTETVMPVITTDSFEWNGVTIPSFTISFEWYERFKPYVDPIVSAFVWIWFVWHVITRFPDLLHGRSILDGIGYERWEEPLPDVFEGTFTGTDIVPVRNRRTYNSSFRIGLPDNSGFSMNGRRMK